jgi:large subunit ribosomal protein L31
MRQHQRDDQDGRELPLYKLDTSSESHPFYTGTQKSVDNMGGRVEKFRNRFGRTTSTAAATAASEAAKA